MNKVKKTYMITLMAVLSLTVQLQSCTGIEFEDVPVDKPYTDLSFKVNWEGSQNGHPEEMMLMMSRIVNTVHFGWILGEDGMLKNTSGQPCSQVNPLPNGDYYAMAVSLDSAKISIPEFDRFLSDPSFSMSSMQMRFPTLSFDEIKQKIGAEIADYNPAYTFIDNVGPVSISVSKHKISPQNDTLIEIRPQRFTQRVNFRINVEVEEGIDTLSILGEMSGLPASANMMSTETSDTSSYRMLFSLDEISHGQPFEDESSRFIPSVWEGHIDVFGIFPAKSSGLIVGPGILQLFVVTGIRKAEEQKPVQPAAAEDYVMRVLRAGINLKDQILAAELAEPIRREEKNTVYKQKASGADIEIYQKLRIRKKQILAGEGNQGLDSWVVDQKCPSIDDEGTEL